MTNRIDEREQFDIPEVLKPYTYFDAIDLAAQLQSRVNANIEALVLRGLDGVIKRYSDMETAELKVSKGQAEQDTIGHFAVVNEIGNVIGSASIYPKLELKKQRFPLPPLLSKGPLNVAYPYANPNVHAWVDKSEVDMLTYAYKDLVYRTSGWWKSPSKPKSWTIEPTRSPEHIHKAILGGGLEKVAIRRFDDGESRVRIPKRSILYARLGSEWFTSRGRQIELRTGERSYWNDEDSYLMSISPKGN